MRHALLLLLVGCGSTHAHEAAPPVPYGAWPSPLTAELAARAAAYLDEPRWGADGVYWLQPRGDGHQALMRKGDDGETVDVVPGADVSTSIHSYGGGAYVVDGRRILYTDATDQRLYLIDGGDPRPLTPAGSLWFADCVIDARRDRAVCVREDASVGVPVDSIVAIDLTGGRPIEELVTGHDFFLSPRINADGTQVAWLSWDLPYMPWNSTDLWVASLDEDGRPGAPVHVAGGPHESIYQPTWSPDGVLYFASDRTGYWNLDRWHDGTIEPVWEVSAEVGLAGEIDHPMFAFTSASGVVAAAIEDGVGRLVAIELATGAVTPITTPYDVMFGGLAVRDAHLVMLAASSREQRSVVDLDLASGATTVIAHAADTELPGEVLATPEAITYPTEDGGRGYAYYYPPRNDAVRAPARERPPLIVRAHGGPTDRYSGSPNPLVLFWTSRGFAVVEVNYGGSTGYGRAYRERLDGQWGVVDVDDCIAAAKMLVARGDVDGERLLIAGGSAGGYTTLAALAFRDVFRAGASWFGIADLEKLDRDTTESNKFESGFTKLLIGPYPERQDLFVARSPIHSADRIRAPVIFFQGADDPVVPPSQSRMMHQALVDRGIPTAYIEFPGEQHGFRDPAHIATALTAQLYFFRRVLEIPTGDSPPPITIDNLAAR